MQWKVTICDCLWKVSHALLVVASSLSTENGQLTSRGINKVDPNG